MTHHDGEDNCGNVTRWRRRLMAKSVANRDRKFVTQARTMRVLHYVKQFRLEVERVSDSDEQWYREISARD